MNSPPLRISLRTAFFIAALTASIVLMGMTIAPMAVALMFAAILAAASYRWSTALARRLGGRPRTAVALMTCGVVLTVLIPVAVATIVVVNDAIDAGRYVADALDKGGPNELVGRLPDRVEGPLRKLADSVEVDKETLTKAATSGGGFLAKAAGGALSATGAGLFNIVLMLVAYVAFLLYGPRLLRWIESVCPLGAKDTRKLLIDFKHTATAVLGSTVVSAAVQAVVAAIGFAIASVPSAAFLGFMTGIAALLPAVGSALVTVPVAVILLASGHTWEGVFIGVYAFLVVAMVDNIIKPWFIGSGTQMNGTVVLFSLLGGMFAFGTAGLLIGPLAVTFFQTMFEFARREIAQDEPDEAVEAPA